jgi:hypothetical protein
VDLDAERHNLHRNVIFRDGKDRADQVIPFSQYDSFDAEDLWDWMQMYEDKTRGQVLAIPHNGNLSNGLMFDDVTFSGDPLSEDYAERRQRWEPDYEITQQKGDGETHSALSPGDEFAGYGKWDRGSFGPEPKTPDMLPREYAREALKRGLAFEAKLGANPFKFGFVAGTDAHTSLATTDEDNYFGKVVILEPSAGPIRFEEVIAGRPAPEGSQMYARELSASGLAAIWARENTREALWDALKRPRGLRDHRDPHPGPGLRRLELQRGRPRPQRLREARLRRQRADGGRSQQPARCRRAELPDPGAARPRRRQPRPDPADQGLARRRRRDPRAGL